MDSDHMRAIEEFLARHGITSFHFQHLGKHPAVIIEFRGKTHRVVFPATGSDWRGPANTVRDLRHALGLVNATKADPRPPRARRVRTRMAQRPGRTINDFQSPVMRVDRFYAPLRALRERMAAEPEESVTETEAKEDANPSLSKEHCWRLRTPFLGRKQRFTLV